MSLYLVLFYKLINTALTVNSLVLCLDNSCIHSHTYTILNVCKQLGQFLLFGKQNGMAAPVHQFSIYSFTVLRALLENLFGDVPHLYTSVSGITK